MAITKKLGIHVPDDIEVIQLPTGFGLPRKCVVIVTYPERARVEMEVELRAGRYEVERLSVLRDPQAPEITGEFLRALTPREDLRAALEKLPPVSRTSSGAVVTSKIETRPPK